MTIMAAVRGRPLRAGASHQSTKTITWGPHQGARPASTATLKRMSARKVPRGASMPIGRPLTRTDRALIQRAQRLLRARYDAKRHTVAAAVRTGSGAVFLGVNLNGIHAPCAEPVALGAAIVAGEPDLVSMVAVGRRGSNYPVLSPCGTCRQMLYDYAPRASLMVRFPDGRLARLTSAESLPAAYATYSPD